MSIQIEVKKEKVDKFLQPKQHQALKPKLFSPNVANLNLVLQHSQIKSPRDFPSKLKKPIDVKIVGPWESAEV